MNNIFVLNKNYKKIGTLSNQGAKPQAPYYNDLYTQELDTGADTYQFSTISNAYTQDCIEIGNHIMFAYKNRNELFTITSLEYSHHEGYKTVGVYAESLSFELLEVYMKKPKVSNSGGSGGTDNDNDGDDNYDDEYADVDDIYIDANGNIIYDKDGSGLGDVTVDGDGNIIYKPKEKKKDRPSDFLEFKNISYPTFLGLILKNTDWNYVCQPGLESNKQDMRVSYDTNIYAILQDSMQSYKGVELEFVFEYNNGKVQKTVKAYKDGGRGSFVGKRFEYGTNVKGITKTQKVANSEDDTVLFVDNIGIEVYYDIDFALKSAEVPEIEIGDTHYVIDKEFHPPMQIKARIGKIEVSFTDPTKNKIYLANNKKISGSVIEDELDDYEEPEITEDPDIPEDPDTPDVPLAPAASSDDMIKAPRMHSYEFLLYTNMFDTPNATVSSRVNHHACVNWAAEANNTLTSKEIHDYLMYNIDVFDVSYKHLDELRYNKTGVPGASNQCLRLVPNGDGLINFQPICNGEFVEGGKDYMSECTLANKVSSRIFSDIMGKEDRPSFDSLFPISNNHFDKHMLDIGSLACGLVSALQHHVRVVHGNNSAGGGSTGDGNSGSGDWIFEAGQINCNNLNTLGLYVYRSTLEDDRAGTEIDGYSVSTETVDAEWGIFDHLVVEEQMTLPNGDIITSSSPSVFGNGNSSGGGNTGTGSTPSNPGTGGDGTFGDIIVDSLKIYSPNDNNYVPVRLTNAGIGADIIVADSEVGTPKLMVSDAYPDDASVTIPPEIVVTRRNTGNSAELKITPDGIEFPDGSTLTTANGAGGGDSIFQKVSDRFYYTDNDIQIERDLYVNGTLHINSGDGMGMGIIDCDILKVTEIQFANGTTLPVNNIATVSELSEYATVEALQEEIRAKDEQIADLEARLARIEAMLGINNDN